MRRWRRCLLLAACCSLLVASWRGNVSFAQVSLCRSVSQRDDYPLPAACESQDGSGEQRRAAKGLMTGSVLVGRLHLI